MSVELHIKIGLYRHYKGNLYYVIGLAKHTETSEVVVVYQGLYGDKDFFVRPYEMFIESVEYEGKIVSRFEFVSEKIL